MAFRPLSSKERTPKCAECGAGSPNVATTSMGSLVWLCTACEYRASHPDAPMVPAHPQVRRPLPLQRETLFGGQSD